MVEAAVVGQADFRRLLEQLIDALRRRVLHLVLVVPQRHGLGRLGERPDLALELVGVHRRLVQRRPGQSCRPGRPAARSGRPATSSPIQSLGPISRSGPPPVEASVVNLFFNWSNGTASSLDCDVGGGGLERRDDLSQLVRLGAGPAVPERDRALGLGHRAHRRSRATGRRGRSEARLDGFLLVGGVDQLRRLPSTASCGLRLALDDLGDHVVGRASRPRPSRARSGSSAPRPSASGSRR